ncbi:MAG: Uncharacterised protein [Acidimicrobiaceae bacterium]|jgi:hypothetical protein|nr:hypothetical protein [Acidimicrobiaceae bacterium]CAI8368581.1 MAG: Uncharacterised protein [Acidimicrobiaceae bacterium]|tara:strand:+ start:502 stop:1080 length:579 start_codon:yes stop_codon:yes gene_type:complete
MNILKKQCTVIALLGVLFSAALISCSSGESEPVEVSTEEMLEEVEYLVITSREHTDENVDYPTIPPAGGNHLGIWHTCGIYKVELLDEAAVHSLEHGAVWVTYKPEIAKEEIIKLTTMLSSRSKILLSPHPEQISPIVATAWGRRLEIESSNDLRLEKFVDFFVDGEAAPEAGITCDRGIGRPPNDPYVLNR